MSNHAILCQDDCSGVKSVVSEWEKISWEYTFSSDAILDDNLNPVLNMDKPGTLMYKCFNKLRSLGPDVLPCVVKEIRDAEPVQANQTENTEERNSNERRRFTSCGFGEKLFLSYYLICAIGKIYKTEIFSSETNSANGKQILFISIKPEIRTEIDKEEILYHSHRILFEQWWLIKESCVTRKFEEIYKIAKTEKDEAKFLRLLDEIEQLGILAIPQIMDKISDGDLRLMKLLSTLTDGEIQNIASKAECMKWWRNRKEYWNKFLKVK